MKNLPIPLQIRLALQTGNRLSAGIGAGVAGFIPLVTYAVMHTIPNPEITGAVFWGLVAMGAGGCIFSLKSVIQWGHIAFAGDWIKAFAFAILLEGMLIVSGFVPALKWFGIASLGYLMAVNAISSACAIVAHTKEHHKETRKQSEIKASPTKRKKPASVIA